MQGSSTNPPNDDALETPSGPTVVEQASGDYEVVARRYRPRKFEELVGQAGLAQALQNAITHHRVGHAYLFTGARGVGKTSTARIFSKALNCEQGPAVEPCGTCEICEGITAGSDVDVLEIDGASNRGIDEIRQLRSNVSVRPSRARFKIYIIDEVHMLTTAAFNALLKTLEEPPAHVKFIFCTTDPEKIPITVLSRCQRFDFAPVTSEDIADKLRAILASEQVEADDEAIRLIARRAAGSVRDSQSLLEQLMAFCSGRITLDEVHQLLGTVQGGRLVAWIEQLQGRDAAGALTSLDEAIHGGADVGQLGEQLLGALRDALALTVGCGPEQALHIDPSDASTLAAFGQSMGVPNLLAMAQIVDQTLTRMRQSIEPRILLEIALVRLCTLENLTELTTMIGQLGNALPPSSKASPQKATSSSAAPKPSPTPVKKNEVALGNSTDPQAAPATPSTSTPSTSAPPPLGTEPFETKPVKPAPIETAPIETPPIEKTLEASATDSAATFSPASAPGKSATSDALSQGSNRSGTGKINRVDEAHRADPGSLDPNVQLQEAGREEEDYFEEEHDHRGARESTAAHRTASTSGDDSAAFSSASLTPNQAHKLWSRVVETVGDTTADFAGDFCRVAISGPNCLVVTLNSPYNREMCERPERRSRLEETLNKLAGRKMRIDFDAVEARQAKPKAGPQQRVSMQQRIREIERHPFVQQAMETLDAQVEEVQLPRPKPKS